MVGRKRSGLCASLSAMICSMIGKVYAEFSNGHEGWYIVTGEHPDGSLVIRPAAPEKIDETSPTPPGRRTCGSARGT